MKNSPKRIFLRLICGVFHLTMIMRLFYLLTISLFFAQGMVFGQADIKIDVKNYDSDTLIFGYYMAERLLVYDTLYRNEDQLFNVQQDSSISPGMYIVVSVPQGIFYQVIVDEADQDFSVMIDTAAELRISFEGSEENELFYSYLDYIQQGRVEVANIDRVLATTDSTLVSIIDQLQKDKGSIDQMVQARQAQIIEQYPQSIPALLLKANLPFYFPEFEGTPEEVQDQKFAYYKERYFENIGTRHPAILRTPFLHERMTYYESNLTHNEPDSLIKTVDYLLGLFEEDSEAYRYYLSYYLNKYANSKFIGMDAVYVHIALNYYAKGKASWITEESRKEIVDNARKLEPVLIGKKAPEFNITQEDGTPIVLSKLDNEYTVVVFWKPSCGHCTKAMPHVLEFQEAYREKGIEVVAICTERGKKAADCWKAVKEKKMEPLLNGIDEFGKDRTVARYYAVSTPMIYVIDKNGEIVIKKVPAENLGAVMDTIMPKAEEAVEE